MAEGFDKDQDRLGEKWISNWEDECIEDWDEQSNMDDKFQTETETTSQKLWQSFQNSASNISQLYKDSQEACKRNMDLGVHYGSVRRTRDILNWVCKRRRHIRREELIAFLCGKPPPVRHRPAALSRSSSRVSMERSSPRLHSPASSQSRAERDEPDLQPFRDALALQGLNGAMSNIGIHTPGSDVGGTGAESSTTTATGMDEFHCFILEEMSRRLDARKRTSSKDVVMADSPTRKRGRFL